MLSFQRRRSNLNYSMMAMKATSRELRILMHSKLIRMIGLKCKINVLLVIEMIKCITHGGQPLSLRLRVKPTTRSTKYNSNNNNVF